MIGVTVDEDVSGKVSPFKRPGVGPWLTEPDKIASWDILVTAKLDRATRSTRDLEELISWCEEHGKHYASVAEQFDLSTDAGRMVARVIGAMATFERERIGTRYREGKATKRQLGSWPGGKPPFGYASEDKRLVQDERAQVARAMAERAVSGESFGQIARWLNDEGIPTLNGGEWIPQTVRSILRSPSLIGHAESRGKVVRDDDGHPVMFTDDPILDEDQWHKLQAALKSRSKPAGARVGGKMLLRVAYCYQCSVECDHEAPCREHDVPLYGQAMKGRAYGYYRCLKCGFTKRTDAVEGTVESGLLREAGGRQVMHRTIKPGDDHSVAIRKVERDIEKLRDISQSPAVKAAIAEQQSELAKLRAMPHQPDRIVWEPTGQTVAEHWASLDGEGKGKFLRDWRVVAYADRDGIIVRLGWLEVDSEAHKLTAAI